MDLSATSVKPKPAPPTEVSTAKPSLYGVYDHFRHGTASARSDAAPVHPLEFSERNYEANKEALTFQALRHSQGLHAPLKLQMERMIVSKVQRMPPLESSNISLDTLTGRDQTLEFSDYLNTSTDTEVQIDGHAAMQKRLRMI